MSDGQSASDTDRPPFICDGCDEPATLVALGGGICYGVECGCEQSDGTPIGTLVKPANVPRKWSVDTGTAQEDP